MTEQLSKASTTPEKSSLETLLGAEITKELDVWIAKYPSDKKRSAVMGGLMLAQRANKGRLTTELMDAVADYLGIAHVAAYEVATFYSMYNMNEVGQYVINVCTNISCMLRGSDEIMNYLKQQLGVEIGGTSRDGLFTLREVECLGACAGGPMFEVDQTYHENLTTDKIDSILDRLATPAG